MFGASMAKMYPAEQSRGCVMAVAVIAFLSIAGGLPAQTNVSIVPPPDWVRSAEWGAPTSRSGTEKSEGTRYLLYEEQENPPRKEEFVHIVLLMQNETGVQDSGSLSFG